jgi:cytochrome c oxidase subunit 4
MTLAHYRKGQTDAEGAEGEVHLEPGGHAHPSAAEYLKIGAILVVVTSIEVALYYVGMSETALVAVMMPLSWLKFILVVLWFMHLRFDNPFFRQLFFAGLALAIVVFTVAMATLGGKLV